MNLAETVQALEAKGIATAINLGAHEHCAIDSNCPLAVELRRLVVDAGVTLEQLLEGYEAVTAADPVNYDLPGIDGKAIIKIGDKVIEVDLDDVVGEQMKAAMDTKRRELGEQEVRVKRLGGGLYTSYLRAIAQARKSPVLPQLGFNHKELLASNCLVTCEGSTYVFLFPCEYKPEYYVNNSVRYKLAASDKKAIKRNTYLEFKIRGGKFLSILLQEKSGETLSHYHGHPGGDCWGHVKLPARWDGELRSLRELVKLCMGSLATINMNSLLEHNPPGMPYYEELKSRGTRVGREGTVAPAEVPPEPEDDE